MEIALRVLDNTYIIANNKQAEVTPLGGLCYSHALSAQTLLLTDVDVDWRTGEVPALADLVLEEALVGLLHILRQVGKEDERGYACAGQLHAVLDLDVLALV